MVCTGVTLAFAVLGYSIASGQAQPGPPTRSRRRLSADLADAGIGTDLRVFAVPGARSQSLAGQVQRATAWFPHLALLMMGANA